ncbi:MAG: zinc ribbon domain-containing protein [Desulfobacterales bacterium]|jgi:putative FmdB family regulatory protein|nr:zinc ribbon domain-containing protein [Desulfobacterales bacterium]
MPIYEYECCQCGKIEEAIQHFSDAPLTTCRHCSGKLSKLISQSSFHLKGSGWFADGYGAKSKEKDVPVAKEAGNTGACSGPEKSVDSGTKASE